MNDLSRLADAVAADPLSITLRLVYADALEEAGDTSSADQQRHFARIIEAAPKMGAVFLTAAKDIVQALGKALVPIVEVYQPLVEAMAERSCRRRRRRKSVRSRRPARQRH